MNLHVCNAPPEHLSIRFTATYIQAGVHPQQRSAPFLLRDAHLDPGIRYVNCVRFVRGAGSCTLAGSVC